MGNIQIYHVDLLSTPIYNNIKYLERMVHNQ